MSWGHLKSLGGTIVWSCVEMIFAHNFGLKLSGKPHNFIHLFLCNSLFWEN
jgi:hypothetical protein